MYVPEPTETVDTVLGMAVATGRTGQWGEHYEVRLLKDGKKHYLHYEDIYEAE